MAESDVSLPFAPAQPVRTLKVTTLINGVPTPVEIQVLALADEQGNLIRLTADPLPEILAELQAIRAGLDRWLGVTESSFLTSR